MKLFKRAVKVANWLVFGKDEGSRSRVIAFLELALDKGKPVEFVINGKGELILKYRREF